MNSRERILALLDGQPVDHLPCMPITMQFAADRIGANYRDYATDYRVQAEGQVRVAEEFGLDHVSVISDPACEAADCGAAVIFPPDQVPSLDESHALLEDKMTLGRLEAPNPARPGRMQNRLQALALLKQRVAGEKLIEGWVEGPCAEAADLRGINTLMLDFYDDPAFVRDLFDFAVAMGLRFAAAQVTAGAELIGVGRPASLVGPRFYDRFVWPAEQRLVEGLHDLGTSEAATSAATPADSGRHGAPRLRGRGPRLPHADRRGTPGDGAGAGASGQHRSGARPPGRNAGHRLSRPRRMPSQAGGRYIVGAGCEVPRDAPPDNLRALVQYAREHSSARRLRGGHRLSR